MGYDQPEIDTVNPYDPPERQALEQKLDQDTHLLHHTHTMEQQEQQLSDEAAAAGYGHSHSDARVADLEHTEQQMGQNVVVDQQNIDHWDHAHPGWQDHLDQYQPADTSSAAADTGDTSASDPYASADDGSGVQN